jgi:hypothetical protein
VLSKKHFFLIIFIVLIIIFDALQQKYYLETFNLEPANITFSQLFKNHLIRWALWVFISIPFSFFIWKRFTKNDDQQTTGTWIQLFGITILSTLASIFLVSIYAHISEDVPFLLNEFVGFYVFFIFQKGLPFLLAFLALTLILFNQSKKQIIAEQLIVIENLEKASNDLELALKSNQEEEPHLNVKTGYRMKPIPLSEIIWIQADDYCVKIHTSEKSFTLRQSLKVLEQKLANHHFIRIHRGALLNLNFLDQVNYDSSTIQLTDTSELPLSKSGIQTLKKRLKESAI